MEGRRNSKTKEGSGGNMGCRKEGWKEGRKKKMVGMKREGRKEERG